MRTHSTPRYLFLGLVLASACGNVESMNLDDELAQDDDPPLSTIESLKADAPKDDSIPFEGKADLQLPARFDIVSLQTPVKSQGRRGVCSIFSTIGLVEMLYKKTYGQTFDFSEQYLQWSVKNQVGAYRNTAGSSDSYNLQAVYRFGIPRESAWPYEPDQWNAMNDPACEGEEGLPTRCYTNGDPPMVARQAFKYRLPSAGRWVSTRSIKNILFERRQGVVVGLDFFYQAWNHRRSTLPTTPAYWNRGYVLYPNAADQAASAEHPAGHSVQIVGWDDNLEVQTVDGMGRPVFDAQGRPVKERGFYIFKNSWGTQGFGIQHPAGPGYGYISYRYVSTYGSGYTADPPRR